MSSINLRHNAIRLLVDLLHMASHFRTLKFALAASNNKECNMCYWGERRFLKPEIFFDPVNLASRKPSRESETGAHGIGVQPLPRDNQLCANLQNQWQQGRGMLARNSQLWRN